MLDENQEPIQRAALPLSSHTPRGLVARIASTICCLSVMLGISMTMATKADATSLAQGDALNQTTRSLGIGALVPSHWHIKGPFSLHDDRTIPQPERARLSRIYNGYGWQAIARGAGGSWHGVSGQSSEKVAVEAALEACFTVDRKCQMYAIGAYRVSDHK